MKYFSTFSGIGGFEIGIQSAFKSYRKTQQTDANTRHGSDDTSNTLQEWGQSATCVGYSEIDKYAIKVYEKQFPGVKNYGDITKINAKELPDFDCLVGGFPCQAFSIAGKRKGFEDTRGTLFFDLARILRAKQPRLFVFENVKGLLSHDGGRTFKTIIQTIDELGYDCQWQVLNSKNHGVPQNRERVYIVGHLRGTPRPQVFPIVGEGSTTLKENTRAIALHNTRRIATIADTVNTLSSSFRGHPDGDGRPAILQLNQPTHSNDRVYASDGISPTLNTMQGGNRQSKVVDDTYGTGLREYKDTAPTLRSNRYGLKVSDDVRIRRLTPVECERLQGFPDNWTAQGTDGAISDTQRYKMCGNAVTTNVVQAVFERIFESTMEAQPIKRYYSNE